MKKLSIGLLAILLGTGLALTQSSFKADHNISKWGYVPSPTPHFVDITGKTEDDSAHPAAGTYSCLGVSSTCEGDDANMPTQLSDLSNTKPGVFRLN